MLRRGGSEKFPPCCTVGAAQRSLCPNPAPCSCQADHTVGRNWVFNGSTALHRAAYYGRADAVTALIGAGASVKVGDIGGATPLIAASMRGNADCVAILLAAGSDVAAHDIHGMDALSIAAENGQVEVTKLLIAAGASCAVADQVLIGSLCCAPSLCWYGCPLLLDVSVTHDDPRFLSSCRAAILQFTSLLTTGRATAFGSFSILGAQT